MESCAPIVNRRRFFLDGRQCGAIRLVRPAFTRRFEIRHALHWSQVNVVLISTYDLGHQPFGLASPKAWLVRDGHTVRTLDLTVDKFSEPLVREAGLVAFYLPMHTATRLALPVIERVRRLNPDARIVCYGLYAPLNADLLCGIGVETILGGEFEADLVRIASLAPRPNEPRLEGAVKIRDIVVPAVLPASRAFNPAFLSGDPERVHQLSGPIERLDFITPDRSDLPAPGRYAQLRHGAESKLVAYTEASRGCKHLCRHCPIVPIYRGQFRVVSRDVVLGDIRQQIAAGAAHVTFGDPDFFNGPSHATRIVEALHAEFPAVTYDATIKIQHLLKHRDLLPVLRDTGCVLITSAVEAVDDRVLEKLEKNHTRRDFFEAAALMRDASIALQPTFIAFTPWTTLAGYRDLLNALADLELIQNVAPVQLALRLLITSGSRLLELDDVLATLRPFDTKSLVYPWVHDDPEVDHLGAQVFHLVADRQKQGRSRAEIFQEICEIAGAPRENYKLMPRATIPFLDEPWYC